MVSEQFRHVRIENKLCPYTGKKCTMEKCVSWGFLDIDRARHEKKWLNVRDTLGCRAIQIMLDYKVDV